MLGLFYRRATGHSKEFPLSVSVKEELREGDTSAWEMG